MILFSPDGFSECLPHFSFHPNPAATPAGMKRGTAARDEYWLGYRAPHIYGEIR